MGKKKKNKFIKLTDEMNYKRHSAAQCTLCHNNNYELYTDIVSVSRIKYRLSDECNKADKAKCTANKDAINMYMEDMIINSNPGFAEKIKVYCPKCEKATNHNIIDYNISSIISILNKFGICTTFSCEGHFDKGEFSSPYISFSQKSDTKYFDMNHALLKYWYIDFGKIQAGEWTLRLKCNQTSIDYFASGNHIDDLYKYIDTVLPEKMKELD